MHTFKAVSMKLRSSLSFLILLVIASTINCEAKKTGDVTFHYEWQGNYGSCGLRISKQNKF